MENIETMVAQLVYTYQNENEIKKSRIEQKVFGSCPKCGSDIKKGKYGSYCSGKCSMKVSQYYFTPFTDEQVRKLLAGEKILLKDVPGKNKKPYDVYLKPTGIEEYQYEKGGKMMTGWQFQYEKTYPKPKNNKKCGN